MYRMRQREFIAVADRGDARAAERRCSSLADAPPRHAVRRAHAHAAGAADDDRALPARGHRAARTRRRPAAGGVRLDQPQPARRLRDHRHRLSDRSPADRAICSGSTAPTGNTYGSIATVDYLLESVSAAAVHARRARPVRPGSAALVHGGVRLPAAGRRLRAGEQHHAAEAQPGGARARARDRQQGARPGVGDHR